MGFFGSFLGFCGILWDFVGFLWDLGGFLAFFGIFYSLATVARVVAMGQPVGVNSLLYSTTL